MSKERSTLLVLALITVCASQIAAWQGYDPNGPAFGEWAFTGKDSAGVVWTGELMLSKADPTQVRDAEKYHSLCSLGAVSDKGGLGVEHPGTYDASGRTFTFGTEGVGSTFTAVLSADGKRLENGTWKQTHRDFESKKLVVSIGEWSAKRVEN
jgi:hypothetical protein